MKKRNKQAGVIQIPIIIWIILALITMSVGAGIVLNQRGDQSTDIDTCAQAEASIYGVFYDSDSQELRFYVDNSGSVDLNVVFYVIHDATIDLTQFLAPANKITDSAMFVGHLITFPFQDISEISMTSLECPEIKDSIGQTDIKGSYEQMEASCRGTVDKSQDCPMADVVIERVFFDESSKELTLSVNNRGDVCLHIIAYIIHQATVEVRVFPARENRITDHVVNMDYYGVLFANEISQVDITSQECPDQVKDSTRTILTHICGDGHVDPGEECDDGNLSGGDGCSADCQLEVCGNGIVEGAEECDDGNNMNGDGCTKYCTLEACGNAVLDSGEECDDGNTMDGDGCDSNCMIEEVPVDTDGDGVADDVDNCDTLAGPASNNGCPEDDDDGDGIIDSMDACPNEYGPIINDGCPYGDYDGDGVTDDIDQCLTEPGPVENNGCPLP
jgi:cysteine-rich repeat protein